MNKRDAERAAVIAVFADHEAAEAAVNKLSSDMSSCLDTLPR